MAEENIKVGVVSISAKTLKDIMDYLQYHESDIAYGIDDFNDLQSAFKAFFHREASQNA